MSLSEYQHGLSRSRAVSRRHEHCCWHLAVRYIHLLGALSLALTGCFRIDFRPPFEEDPGLNGASGNARFSVNGQPVSARPVAAGGAVARVWVQLLDRAPALAKV